MKIKPSETRLPKNRIFFSNIQLDFYYFFLVYANLKKGFRKQWKKINR